MGEKINYNFVILAGAAVAVFYFWNSIRSQKADVITAKTELTEAKAAIVEERQEEKTERVAIRQENKTARVKTVIDAVFNKNKSAATQKVEKGTFSVPSYANGQLKFSDGQGFSVSPEKAKTLVLQKTALDAGKVFNKIPLKPTPFSIKGVKVYN